MPFHPFFVHFPFAFLFGALIFHSVYLFKPNWISRVISLWLVGLSTIFSIFASISGGKELIKAGEKGYSSEILDLMKLHEI